MEKRCFIEDSTTKGRYEVKISPKGRLGGKIDVKNLENGDKFLNEFKDADDLLLQFMILRINYELLKKKFETNEKLEKEEVVQMKDLVCMIAIAMCL